MRGSKVRQIRKSIQYRMMVNGLDKIPEIEGKEKRTPKSLFRLLKESYKRGEWSPNVV